MDKKDGIGESNPNINGERSVEINEGVMSDSSSANSEFNPIREEEKGDSISKIRPIKDGLMANPL